MINTSIKKTAAGLLAAATLMGVFVALPASAATASSTAATQAQRLSTLISKSDQAIAVRITALNTLNTKVQAMKNVSAAEKTSITSEVQTEISNLTASKAKVDADTVLSSARADASAAITSSRIYALVIPQGYIEVSSDRIDTISSLMTALGTKLQARIAAAEAAGKDVTALQAALADIGTQTAAAHAQAATALSGVSGLVPDQGNKTVLAANSTALKAARANIKTGTADLKTARQDIQTIVNGLKSFHLGTGSTASTTAQ